MRKMFKWRGCPSFTAHGQSATLSILRARESLASTWKREAAGQECTRAVSTRFRLWEKYQMPRDSTLLPGSRDMVRVLVTLLTAGMPRILGATAYVVPQMLTELGVEYRTPEVALMFPELPEPFLITPGRLESLKSRTPVESQREGIVSALESAKKSFCAAYA